MPPQRTPPQVRDAGDTLGVVCEAYAWRWTPSTDEFVLADADGRAVVRSPLQPAVETTGRSSPGPGRCVEHSIDGPRLRAMKQAEPRVAVLYYCLTPLFARYMDLSGADDLWMSRGAYDAGFARRALLSSWCGAFGVVPYASSGYDWRSMREIWLDTAVIGTPGVIAPLAGDEYGDKLTPELAAIYNGLTRITRRNPLYRVEFFDAELSNPADGPRARTWAHIENGAPVVVTLRPGEDGIARAPSIAESNCAAVVASLTDDGIGAAASIGIVPFEPGRVAIERAEPRRAAAQARLLSGRVKRFDAIDVEPGRIIVNVATQLDGEPVELIEIHFA